MLKNNILYLTLLLVFIQPNNKINLYIKNQDLNSYHIRVWHCGVLIDENILRAGEVVAYERAGCNYLIQWQPLTYNCDPNYKEVKGHTAVLNKFGWYEKYVSAGTTISFLKTRCKA